jgi:hypothetical protein
MAQNQDYVLILERSSSNLKPEKQSNDIYLEGIAAVFGKENSNQRIYEEREYLPHLDYLNEKITQRRLCGELDHPKEFDVSLKNLSHVIEKLVYNKEDRTVRIRVKLLDTPAGQIARSLVEAGIPISISSRAAGTVGANKRVEIKRIFTYDLVADPGFENAQLGRVYESFGYDFEEKAKKNSVLNGLSMINENFGLRNDSNIRIYRINDQEKISKLLSRKENTITNKQASMENFVTAEELNEYSRLLKKEMDSIKTAVSTLQAGKKSGVKINEKAKSGGKTDMTTEERLSKLEKYADYLAENLEASIKYSEYLSEHLETAMGENKKMEESVKRVIAYSKYLAEHLDNNISYAEYIAENFDTNSSKINTLEEKVKQAIQYSEYIAENVDKGIRYSEYLAENLDKNISYSEYLAENLDKNISYSEYLAENVDRNISYSEYLAENLDRGIRYSEYIGEKLNRNIAYSDYLGENLGKNIQYSEYIAEKLSNNIGYSEYIAESMNALKGNKSLNNEIGKAVNENSRVSGFSGDYSNISNKIDNLLESVNKQKTEELINEKKYAFLNLVSPEVKNGFLGLNEAEKQKVAKKLNESNYSSEKEVVSIMGDALTEQNRSGEKFLDMMPEQYKGAWEAMNEAQKASIIAQSKSYRLETSYQINNFWKTRGITIPAKNVQALDESKSNTTKTGYNSAYINSIAEQLGARFGRK